MTTVSTKKGTAPKKKHHVPRVRFNEIVLLILVAVLAAGSIYFASDQNTAFGVLDAPIVNTELAVVRQLNTHYLVEQPVLDLEARDLTNRDQLPATLIDPVTPAPVENLVARTTRVGGEVLVTWTMPEGPGEVNVFRSERSYSAITDADESSKKVTEDPSFEMIHERLGASSLLDEGLDQDLLYTYRVMTVMDYDDGTYSSESRSVDVVPRDEIAPSSPSGVMVISDHSGGRAGLAISWTMPTVDDLDHIEVYRSDVFGDRGVLAGTIKADKSPYLFDDDAEPNALVYYTVVAVDGSGNSSQNDFQLPPAGNDRPFEPLFNVTEGDEG